MKMFKLSILVVLVFLLASCTSAQYMYNNFEAAMKGREQTITTYDENSQIIDRIEGKSISIGADDKFSVQDSNGKTVKKSDVLSLTVGGKSMVHVGSSLIIADKGLPDVFNEFTKKVDIKNFNRSTPIINRMVNDMKNYTTGQSLLILVRSQSGIPLAAYVGNKVGYFATDIDKSTGLVIDGKSLFIYRCDYTMYDLSLLQ
jgi:hypothetical protein